MDQAIIPITSVVASVLSSLKNARDLVKDTSNSELRDQINAAYDSLLDLKASLFEMDDENRRLKSELAKKAEIDGPVPPFGYFFDKEKPASPLCPKCYQGKDRMLSMMSAPQPWSGGTRRDCRICGLTVWEKEMDLSVIRPARKLNPWT